MNAIATLEQWHHGLRIFHRAHSRAAASYDRKNMALGLPTVILTAVAGTTVFTTLSSTSTEQWVTVMTGIMSIAAAVLAALQTFLRYSELSERHRTAAQKYGVLRREIEEVLAGDPAAPLPPDFLKSFREQWDAVDAASPNLPQSIYDSVEKELAPQAPKAQ
jgi:conflict system pore-forming effector with SLATT domain/protein expressed in petal formation